VTIEEIQDAYPTLDVVSHNNRKKLMEQGYKQKQIPRVEAIVLIGEPVNWESHLQLLVDLLITNGEPNHCPKSYPEVHLPILVCNTDLVFMAEACMPRLAHGSFLVCLESLYERITGNKLIYTAIIGKPSEVTYRFAEHTIAIKRRQMGYVNTPLRKLYFIGDNPEVDIVGANIYNKFVSRFRRLSSNSEKNLNQDEIAQIRRQAAVSESRIIPDEAVFVPHECKAITSILVGTGVYNPDQGAEMAKKFLRYRHRDFEKVAELSKPDHYFENCLDAIKFILAKEKFDPRKTTFLPGSKEVIDTSSFSRDDVFINVPCNLKTIYEQSAK